jgi:transcriptional regulator with XRE-family HTH domain
MSSQPKLTPLAAFIESELERLNMSQQQLEAVSGIPDTTIMRIRAGQEAKPSQLARFAKAFERDFWYVVQRAGYSLGPPGDPSQDAQRLGVVFADDPELSALSERLLRLSPPNRKAVVRMIQVLLEGQSDPPALQATE